MGYRTLVGAYGSRSLLDLVHRILFIIRDGIEIIKNESNYKPSFQRKETPRVPEEIRSDYS